MSRSDKFTPLTKKEYYSDFLMNFDMNPVTGILARTTNEDAIKQSLKNLILTNMTERPYSPLTGSRINSLMFDPIDPFTMDNIKTEIRQTITNNEPRVNIIDIFVKPSLDQNTYIVNIIFSVINIPQEIRLEIFLQRVR